MSKIINCVIKVGEARADWWKKHMSSLLPNINFFLMRENYEKDIYRTDRGNHTTGD